MNLYQRLHSSNIETKAAAHEELSKSALEMGMTPQALYGELQAHVEKRMKDDEDAKAAYDDEDRKVKADGDADADDDDMDGSERANRGISRAAYDEDEADDDVKTKSVPGHKSKVARGVSFVDKVFSNDSRQYPLESQESARQPRGVDTTSDNLGREYGNEVMARIAGPMARIEGGDPDAIPSAGAGPTLETTTQGIAYDPESFMPGGEGDAGRVGGEDRGVAPARPNLGSTEGGGYLDVERVSAVTRVGPNFVLGAAHGIAPAASAKFPDAAQSVTKSKRPKGLFSNIVRGPEAGSSDGQS
jgi:hypothetical protein